MSNEKSRLPEGAIPITVLVIAGVALWGVAGLYMIRNQLGIKNGRAVDYVLNVVLRPFYRPPMHGHGNETSAISTLRNISSSQAQFVAGVHVDLDGDGVGEFGTFGELSGGVVLRGRGHPLDPPVLSGAFRTIRPPGAVDRSGYRFRMYLVATDGLAVGERVRGGVRSAPTATCDKCCGGRSAVANRLWGGLPADAVDPDGSEKRWVCYAWPNTYDRSGVRTFVVDHTGDIYGTDDPIYTGLNGPAAGAAFTDGDLETIGSALGAGGTAHDGNPWQQVN